MIDSKLRRTIAEGNFEDTEYGLFVPKCKQFVRGVFIYGKRGEPEEMSRNEVVLGGLNYMLAAALTGISPIPTWYVAVFSGDVVVQSSWTADNFASSAIEFTNYTAGARPKWSPGSVAAGAVNSFSSKAEFQSSVDAATIRGAALLSNASKGSTNGTLLAASRFPSTKNLDTDEILDVGYGIELLPA
jgi:hypothetical protein